MKNQFGRSMVEMLGVLGVIGLLSIAGIEGYQYAVLRHRSNVVLKMAHQIAADIVNLPGMYQQTIDGYELRFTNRAGMTLPFAEGNMTATKIDDTVFRVNTPPLEQEQCKAVLKYAENYPLILKDKTFALKEDGTLDNCTGGRGLLYFSVDANYADLGIPVNPDVGDDDDDDNNDNPVGEPEDGTGTAGGTGGTDGGNTGDGTGEGIGGENEACEPACSDGYCCIRTVLGELLCLEDGSTNGQICARIDDTSCPANYACRELDGAFKCVLDCASTSVVGGGAVGGGVSCSPDSDYEKTMSVYGKEWTVKSNAVCEERTDYECSICLMAGYCSRYSMSTPDGCGCPNNVYYGTGRDRKCCVDRAGNVGQVPDKRSYEYCYPSKDISGFWCEDTAGSVQGFCCPKGAKRIDPGETPISDTIQSGDGNLYYSLEYCVCPENTVFNPDANNGYGACEEYYCPEGSVLTKWTDGTANGRFVPVASADIDYDCSITDNEIPVGCSYDINGEPYGCFASCPKGQISDGMGNCCDPETGEGCKCTYETIAARRNAGCALGYSAHEECVWADTSATHWTPALVKESWEENGMIKFVKEGSDGQLYPTLPDVDYTGTCTRFTTWTICDSVWGIGSVVPASCICGYPNQTGEDDGSGWMEHGGCNLCPKGTIPTNNPASYYEEGNMDPRPTGYFWNELTSTVGSTNTPYCVKCSQTSFWVPGKGTEDDWSYWNDAKCVSCPTGMIADERCLNGEDCCRCPFENAHYISEERAESWGVKGAGCYCPSGTYLDAGTNSCQPCLGDREYMDVYNRDAVCKTCDIYNTEGYGMEHWLPYAYKEEGQEFSEDGDNFKTGHKRCISCYEHQVYNLGLGRDENGVLSDTSAAFIPVIWNEKSCVTCSEAYGSSGLNVYDRYTNDCVSCHDAGLKDHWNGSECVACADDPNSGGVVWDNEHWNEQTQTYGACVPCPAETPVWDGYSCQPCSEGTVYGQTSDGTWDCIEDTPNEEQCMHYPETVWDGSRCVYCNETPSCMNDGVGCTFESGRCV